MIITCRGVGWHWLRQDGPFERTARRFHSKAQGRRACGAPWVDVRDGNAPCRGATRGTLRMRREFDRGQLRVSAPRRVDGTSPTRPTKLDAIGTPGWRWPLRGSADPGLWSATALRSASEEEY